MKIANEVSNRTLTIPVYLLYSIHMHMYISPRIETYSVHTVVHMYTNIIKHNTHTDNVVYIYTNIQCTHMYTDYVY